MINKVFSLLVLHISSEIAVKGIGLLTSILPHKISIASYCIDFSTHKSSQ